ncbi:relaxase/mobilization nuclease domain-containing protein [Amnibacterium endophyticum]|uniref:Relaxase/mobilization nuclease domain-containing protein n=1 Tax=Amnibacterium endophyticum TaxID=2109337 RepID=A0ABW4LG29_9MICO
MIASISRGGDLGGLLAYLAGPGRSNEHTEQHLIAGDAAVMTMYGTDTLDRAAATEIAASLDAPRREFGVEVTRLLTHVDTESGETVRSRVDGSVWHCSLSLAAEEGQLTDDRWAAIVEDFVTRMGFAGDNARADCRWVAVRHGLSLNGNDHVHVAVSLVREDGTKASVHNDYQRAMQTVRELEQRHGLQPLVPVQERAFHQREETRAAREAAARRGLVEVDAKTLERYVRAAATASLDEAEFVRRLRREGLLVHPRYATGRDDVVTGYAVALRPAEGEKPVWHGGQKLARDLSLPELRKGWPDRPDSATEAVVEWRAVRRGLGRVPARAGREAAELHPDLFAEHVADIAKLRDYLTRVPVDDYAIWAHAARDMAGMCAAWSRRIEPTPGPLADAARILARSAQLRPIESRPRPIAMPSIANTVALVSATATAGRNATAELLLLRQFAVTARSIHAAATAAGDAARAEQLNGALRDRLRQVRDSYLAIERSNALQQLSPEQQATAARAAIATSTRGGPVPTPLTPHVSVPTTRGGGPVRPGQDLER